MTIFGWDMSHFDAPSIGGAVAEGFRFITHKAGGDATDAELDDWWAGVRDLDDRVLLGAYWVLYPGTPTSRADAFLARLDAACDGWRDRPFILQVDCEKWNGDVGTVPSMADIRAFCDRLVARMPNLRPIVYAPKWVYNDSLAGLGYPLWASSYVAGSGLAWNLYPGDESSRWSAYSGQQPAILQFTDSADIGGQSTCDANAFRGTFDQLVALVAPGWSDLVTTQAEFNTLMATFLSSKAGLDAMARATVRRPVENVQKRPAGSVQTTTIEDMIRYLDVRALRSDALVTSVRDTLTSATTAQVGRDKALAADIAALPKAVAAELGDVGGADPAAVEAAVSRALSRLRLVADKTAA